MEVALTNSINIFLKFWNFKLLTWIAGGEQLQSRQQQLVTSHLQCSRTQLEQFGPLPYFITQISHNCQNFPQFHNFHHSLRRQKMTVYRLTNIWCLIDCGFQRWISSDFEHTLSAWRSSLGQFFCKSLWISHCAFTINEILRQLLQVQTMRLYWPWQTFYL